MKLCKDCKFIANLDPASNRALEPACTRPEVAIVDPVDGAVTLPKCREQRERREGFDLSAAGRCGYDGMWFKPKG